MSKCAKCGASIGNQKFCKQCGHAASASTAGTTNAKGPAAEVERLLLAQAAERDARRKTRQQAVASRDSGRPVIKPSVDPAALQAEAAAQAARIAELESAIEAQDDAVEKLQEALAQKAQRILDLEEALEAHKAAPVVVATKAVAAKPAVATSSATLRCSVCNAERAADAYSASQRKKKGKRVCQPCVVAKSKPVAVPAAAATAVPKKNK